MPLLQFKCRICKQTQEHETIEEFGGLPHGLVLVECQGCGVKGIENLANEVKSRKKVITKTYLTTEQFIKVYSACDKDQIDNLSKAWYEAWYAAWNAARNEAWYAAWYADLAVLVRDKITIEQFTILTDPWMQVMGSLYREDFPILVETK